MNKSNPKSKRKLTLGSALVVLVVASVMIGTGWGLASYIELLQLQVEVADGCSRIDAASRSRVALATNLIQTAPSLVQVEAGPLERIDRLVRGARDLTLSPSGVANSSDREAYQRAQNDLTAALDEFWSHVRLRSGTAEPVAEMRARLDRSTLQIAESMRGLEHSVDAYHEAAGSFPGSVLISAAGLERRPLMRRSADGVEP